MALWGRRFLLCGAGLLLALTACAGRDAAIESGPLSLADSAHPIAATPRPATPTPAPSPDATSPRVIPFEEAEAPPPPRLLIPVLGVDEAVVTVSIVNGTWNMSHLNTGIGWLESTGRAPGDSLAMAFVGHVTVSAAQRGPFARLWRAHAGDEVIYRAGGTDYVYTIREKANVSPDEVRQLYVNDGRRLLLITCTGWDYLEFSYPQRLIVEAELARESATP
jgi:LPXTG-site transpeptidase (sortase) family protein